MFLSEELQITAPAPGAVLGVSAQITGSPGLATYYYWWTANYPIGLTVVSAPLLVRGAPSPLTVANHVTITGRPALGATSYDLLRTNSPQLPSTAPSNIAIAAGLPSPTFQDVGDPPLGYDIIGLPAGAPVSQFITLNNRDRSTPTLVFNPWPIAVPSIVFPDGTSQSTAGAPANQLYNWQQDVQANQHNLLGVACVRWDAVNAFPAGQNIFVCADDFGSLQISFNAPTSFPNGRFWFTPMGQLGIGQNNQLVPDSVVLALGVSPGLNSQQCVISVTNFSGSGSYNFGAAGSSPSVPAPIADGFIIVGGSGTSFLMTNQGDVLLGVDTPNISDPTGRPARLFVTIPSLYSSPTNSMLWLLNKLEPCLVHFESSSATNGGVSLFLQTTTQNYEVRVTPNNGLLLQNTLTVFDNIAGAPRLTLTNAGNFGIGTFTPTHLLELNADSAAKPTTNTWTITSDIRTKRNVRPLEGGMNVIAALEPIIAEYNGYADTPEGSRVVSFDPDKLAPILPSAVKVHRGKLRPEDGEETDIKGVNNHEVIFHLILAVQQLAEQLKKLEVRN